MNVLICEWMNEWKQNVMNFQWSLLLNWKCNAPPIGQTCEITLSSLLTNSCVCILIKKSIALFKNCHCGFKILFFIYSKTCIASPLLEYAIRNTKIFIIHCTSFVYTSHNVTPWKVSFSIELAYMYVANVSFDLM